MVPCCHLFRSRTIFKSLGILPLYTAISIPDIACVLTTSAEAIIIITANFAAACRNNSVREPVSINERCQTMNKTLIYSTLTASLCCSAILLVTAIVFLRRYVRRWFFGRAPAKGFNYPPFRKRLLRSTLLLLLAVWFLRFSVGYYAITHRVEDIPSLTFTETLFDSLVHVFQTFSMDEDYTAYIKAGKEMILSFNGSAVLSDIYGIYAAVLNTLVPIAGGAILFELISEFFPQMQLMLATAHFWTEKWYFSELNDNSLALAKSTVEYNCRIHIIFTDAYSDSSDESCSERLNKAVSIGAICVRDDVQHIKIRGKRTKIFLIDSSENTNLQTLSGLLEQRDQRADRTEIYVFSSDSKFSQLDGEVSLIVDKAGKYQFDLLPEKERAKIIQKAYNSLNAEDRSRYDSDLTEEQKLNVIHKFYVQNCVPDVIPINGVRNMATNLFRNVPLYEPLIDKQARDGIKELNLTIFGSGVIGTEVFLTAYWCGQMLDCRLNITVISKERQNSSSDSSGTGDFEGRINRLNPDILETAKPDSPILICNRKGSRNEPYFYYRYIQADVLSDDLTEFLREKELLDTDYFVVALGSDEENFSIADRLRQSVGAHHLFKADGKKTVISYVIYNSDLSRMLNKSNRHRYSVETETPDVLMCAFGDLESVYSIPNVFFDGQSDKAYEIGNRYDQSKLTFNETEHRKTRTKRLNDTYSHQANLAKAYHRKYREYSAGFHTKSMFTVTEQTMEQNCIREPEKNYLDFVYTEKTDMRIPCPGGTEKSREQLLHELAWLEHRRWCAFLRTRGFRNPGSDQDFERYYSRILPEHTQTDHKFISLKLHPCLIECSKNGILADLCKYGTIDDQSKLPDIDLLDELSLKRHKLRVRESQEKHTAEPAFEDFKKYDYPEFELDDKEKDIYLKKRRNSSGS